MKKLAILFVAPVLVYAVSLQELLDTAVKNNNIVASYKLTEKSKQKDLDASKNSYYPTIDIGGNYQSLQEKSPNRPGDVYSGFINIGVDLYDGGYKSSRVDSSKAALLSSKLQTSAYIKSLEYAIVEDFYDIKNVESKIKALKEKSVQLKAELQRVKQFFEVGSATKDEIDRLQAALSNNIYSIESSKYQLSSLKQSLGIKVGKEIKNLDDAMITTPTFKGEELSDEIKAMIANTEVYTYNAKSIDSNYNPKFRLENAYTVYEYDRDDAAHPNSIDNQNRLTLSFSMKLYDNGSMKNQKESVLLQKRALESQIAQSKQTQKVNVQLATLRIDTAKAQIISANNSLESAKSAYKTILQKYKVGVVDNVAYLDALSTQTDAQAQYERARNDLQVAYAAYYFYTNKNIKEFVK